MKMPGVGALCKRACWDARVETAPTGMKMRLPHSVGKDRLIFTFHAGTLELQGLVPYLRSGDHKLQRWTAIANYRGLGSRNSRVPVLECHLNITGKRGWKPRLQP